MSALGMHPQTCRVVNRSICPVTTAGCIVLLRKNFQAVLVMNRFVDFIFRRLNQNQRSQEKIGYVADVEEDKIDY